MNKAISKYLTIIKFQQKLIDQQTLNINHYIQKHTKLLDLELKKHRDQSAAAGMKAYMKEMPFDYYGINTPTVRSISRDIPQFYVMLFSHYSQYLGIEAIRSRNFREDSQKYQQRYAKYIQGWAMCDSVAKVIRLAALNDQHKDIDRELFSWKFENDNTWVRRVALVSFVVRARHGDDHPNYAGFMQQIFAMCKECLKYDQRFNQLGVGWLLRQMTLADKKKTIDFIKEHYKMFIRQGLRYAIEKLTTEQKNQLLDFGNEKPAKKQPRKK